MLHAALIPHEAIQIFAEGGKMMIHRGRVQPLFPLEDAARMLGMSIEKVKKLLRARKLFGVVPRKGQA